MFSHHVAIPGDIHLRNSKVSSLLKDSEFSVTETCLSVVGRKTVAMFPRSLYKLWCKKLFSDIMAFNINSEHREALRPPGPYKPSGINNIQKEHNQHLKLSGLNLEKTIARVYFIEIVYSFKTLRKRAALAFLPSVLVKEWFLCHHFHKQMFRSLISPLKTFSYFKILNINIIILNKSGFW